MGVQWRKLPDSVYVFLTMTRNMSVVVSGPCPEMTLYQPILKKILTASLSRVIPSRFMANTKSAIKRIRRIRKQTSVNKARKSRYKTALKKMNGLIENKDKKKALAYLPKLNSELMKIAKTGIVKKGNASRNISRITRKISAL